MQGITVVSITGLAAFDLTIPDSEVTWHVYVALVAVAIGIAPENIWSLFKPK